MFQQIKEYIQYFGKFIIDVIGIYICWLILHLIAANLYTKYCAELSLWGIIKSAFVIPAPHCQAMRWIITTGGSIITQMWVVLGTWFCAKLCKNLMNKE